MSWTPFLLIMEISDKLIDKLVDKFLDLLTDKIAEKVAEKIYKDSIPIPNTPTTPSTPINPIYPPYPDRKGPLDMIAVMYGVISTPYTAVDGINTVTGSKAETSFTNQTKIGE